MDNVTDIRPIKKKLRSNCKEARRNMDVTKKAAIDRKIQNKLLNLWMVRNASSVLTYVSTPIEVSTEYFINELFKRGKTVAVPKCENDKGDMSFYVIHSVDELENGYFGVKEPVPENCEMLTDFENSVCIVPAFLFDSSGYRLGYGKGFYDRFIAKYPGKTVGICYDENVIASLMHGKYDRTVDYIITEKQILTTIKEN